MMCLLLQGSVWTMLPIVHKYDFGEMLEHIRLWFAADTSVFVSSKDSDGFVLRWGPLSYELTSQGLAISVLCMSELAGPRVAYAWEVNWCVYGEDISSPDASQPESSKLDGSLLQCFGK